MSEYTRIVSLQSGVVKNSAVFNKANDGIVGSEVKHYRYFGNTREKTNKPSPTHYVEFFNGGDGYWKYKIWPAGYFTDTYQPDSMHEVLLKNRLDSHEGIWSKRYIRALYRNIIRNTARGIRTYDTTSNNDGYGDLHISRSKHTTANTERSLRVDLTVNARPPRYTFHDDPEEPASVEVPPVINSQIVMREIKGRVFTCANCPMYKAEQCSGVSDDMPIRNIQGTDTMTLSPTIGNAFDITRAKCVAIKKPIIPITI